MVSKWSDLKSEAIKLRRQGKSLPLINKQLGIPKSTLSSWLKNVELSVDQKNKLETDRKNALVKARSKAVISHNHAKAQRIKISENQGRDLLNKIDYTNINITELALALLYLGEGTKAQDETGMGSSDPVILNFFVTCLRTIYKIPEDKIKCELHLRADQDPNRMLEFWSKELSVSKQNFRKPYLDKRTEGTQTYDSYKGVCLVRCGTVAIQRKLVYIAKHFCTEISAKV